MHRRAYGAAELPTELLRHASVIPTGTRDRSWSFIVIHTAVRNPLLTDPPRHRQMYCEEPNFSCDDRCNAPIIRRKGSALLFLDPRAECGTCLY